MRFRPKLKKHIHEYWLAVLAVRGDYKPEDFEDDKPDKTLLIELDKALK